MPISINGSGTISGISVGGLENGCVNEADLATAAVTETKLASNAVTPDKLSTGGPNWDSSGRLLVGTSTNISNRLIQAESTGSSSGLSVRRNGNNTGAPFLDLRKSRSASVGDFTSVVNGDPLGVIQWLGADGSADVVGATIQAVVDGTPGANDMPGRLVFSTTADGASSPTERMRLASGGNVFAQGVYDVTTANAANVNSASDGGLRRSTSSIKYKQSVETIEDRYSDALLQCRPVWYRSTCQDDCAEHSWWGFIAEEVAEIDPRLVHWKTTEPVVQDDGSLEHVTCDPEPEGVAYDRFVPHLLNLIKRQKEQIETLEAQNAQFEARLTALEGGTN